MNGGKNCCRRHCISYVINALLIGQSSAFTSRDMISLLINYEYAVEEEWQLHFAKCTCVYLSLELKGKTTFAVWLQAVNCYFTIGIDNSINKVPMVMADTLYLQLATLENKSLSSSNGLQREACSLFLWCECIHTVSMCVSEGFLPHI